MVEVGLERLDGVGEALVQADRARGRGGKRVEQRYLDQIVALIARGDEAARLADVHPDLGARIQIAGEVGIAVLDQADQLRVELDRIDLAGVVIKREQRVGAAAGAEDQDLRRGQQVIRQRRRGVVQVGERLQVVVECGDRGQAVAVGEHRDLGGRLEQVVEAEARGVAERDLAALHRAKEAKRAGALGVDHGARHPQRLAQAFVGRELEGGPDGRQGEHHGQGTGGVEQRPDAASAAAVTEADQRRREHAERADQLQRPARHDHEQQAQNAERAEAGAEQIGAIDPPDRIGEARQRQADGGRAAEERHDQDRVQRAQIQDLARVPDQLEGIERQSLGEREADDRGDPEQRGEAGERRARTGLQASAGEGQKRAARAVAEQRDADHHVSEVVPLDDREQAREQHLVREHRGRDQADREQPHHALVRATTPHRRAAVDRIRQRCWPPGRGSSPVRLTFR